MPIIEESPWLEQYFQNVNCPEEIIIATDDRVSYKLYPLFRWVFNKLLICETQQLEHGPHGIEPSFFPVFSKPIYNLRGTGIGSRILQTKEEYDLYQQPGHLWMELLEGEHVSSDVAVIDGQTQQWWHVVGKPGKNVATFDYWAILNYQKPEIEEYCGKWLEKHLKGYTGIVNIETINTKMIEVHLRFSDQWPDLYGKHFVQTVVNLYTNKIWQHVRPLDAITYSVVIFLEHGYKYIHPYQTLVNEILRDSNVASLQITFDENKSNESHATPYGGFRLAAINCFNLDSGVRAREKLTHFFLTTRSAII